MDGGMEGGRERNVKRGRMLREREGGREVER